jgi:acyl transferase domain-containing protein
MTGREEGAPADDEGVAIIGMAGRFPGAPDVRSLWRNICAGLDSIGRFTVEELEDGRGGGDGVVAARGILEGAEEFDAAFFGMKPREAALTDPQHRLFLETVWQAIEDAGHDPVALASQPVGVFAGCSMPTYLLHHVLQDRAAVERFTGTYQGGDYAVLVGALGDALATRVSYKLDLRGPSMTIQTACSTSLVAVAQAVQSLLMQQCDMAVAGGASITFPQRRGYQAQEGGMAAPDGRCRPFDAAAGGTVFSHGCAAVLLRRLADARAAGDPIYAVIRGAAVNNDGAAKVGFTAPSVEMQAEVVATAQAIAGVPPRSIGYVECHGTGTTLGDPIEVAALARAFGEGTGEAGFCALGSIKGNIGHLDAAAGVAGLIKAALCVERGVLPPTAHFETPNPRLPLEGSPFFIQAGLGPWPEPQRPRRAGVSALGVGGTNAHVVIEEAPPRAAAGPARPFEVLTLSARSEAALARMRAALAECLREEPALDLGDVAHTLQAGRRAFPHRWAAAAGDRVAALAALEAGGAAAEAAEAPRLVFLFPGQGSQYPGMGAALYHAEPAFRAAFDRCADILLPRLDLREALYGAPDAEAVTHTLLAQPAIFAVEYALAQLWLGWGLRPAALAGHSVGELVAATVAGSIALEDALALVAERGRLMEAQPCGVMLAVRLSEAELLPLLGDGAGLAAVNAPQLCVAAGPEQAMVRLEARLAGRGVQARRLHTSHAFHSAMMDPVVAPLTALVSRMPLAPPAIPWVSGVTGGWITAEEATSPAYWGRHCRSEVRFAAAMATLAAAGPAVLLEVGPGATLVTLARQGAGRGMAAIASLPDAQGAEDTLAFLHQAAAHLWTSGLAPDWAAMRQWAPRRRVSLPGYAFERTRHWIDAPGAAPSSPLPIEARPMTEDSTARAQRLIREVIAELAGEAMPEAAAGTSFVELGFDSLFLSQLSQALLARFGVQTSFRQLLRDLGTLEALAAHAAPQLPAPPVPTPLPVAAPAILPAAALAAAGTPGLEGLLRAQVEAMSGLMLAQLDVLKGQGEAAPPTAAPAAAMPPPPAPTAETEMESRFRRFTAGGKPPPATLTAAQEGLVAELAARSGRRMAGSRGLTERYRGVLADPRAAAGFRHEWKELVHPIVCARAQGAYLWDVDGHAYVDLVNGYGVTALGHSPDFVTEAVAAQLRRGFPIGPMADLAGPVAEGIAELTGHERVSFTCTGSEAVMAALRIARAVTGRKRVVAFAGAYHGGFDEVLVRGVWRGGEPRAMPAAAGITEEAVANMTILEFAEPASLDWIKAHAGELAAVLVEPVQSRHPGLQPRDFIRALREVTAEHGCALIMDEVVTGFRIHPGGAQALFGVRGDLATYGKVIGGGLPIGVLAGSARFMDALDGGGWRFGDDSGPEAEVTVFAGTFVRHPLALAAAQAVLAHLKAAGPALQAQLEETTRALTGRLDALFARRGLAMRTERWGSMFFLNPAAEDRRASLLYPLLRERGVHIQENFPCFLTTAHGPAEVELVVRAFEGALEEVQRVGILASREPVAGLPAALPLSEPQMEVWLAAQLGEEASCAFNEGVRVDLEGALDASALERALAAAVARHEALRARFLPTGEAMTIDPPAPVPLPVENLAALPAPEQAAAIEAAMAAFARQPFDLVAGPCLRAALLRCGPARHTLLLSAHHIVCDGWSVNILIEELAALYGAEAGGTAAALPAPLSFSRQVRTALPDAATDAHWLGRFHEPPPPLDLPADRPRPARKSVRGATLAAGARGRQPPGGDALRHAARPVPGAHGAAGAAGRRGGGGADGRPGPGRGDRAAGRPLGEPAADPRPLGLGDDARRASRRGAGGDGAGARAPGLHPRHAGAPARPAADDGAAAAGGCAVQPRADGPAGRVWRARPQGLDHRQGLRELRPLRQRDRAGGRAPHRVRLQHRPVRRGDGAALARPLRGAARGAGGGCRAAGHRRAAARA